MKATWLGITLLLLLLTACDARSDITIDSTQISQQQANTIKQNIASQYPNASAEEKQHIADVAVKAIENLVFVEGGSFDMGDLKAPCEFPSKRAERIIGLLIKRLKGSFKVPILPFTQSDLTSE